MTTRPTFDPGFSTEELTGVFSAESTVGAWLEFEVALVLALADAGIAPAEEAAEVAAACRLGVADPEAVLASTWEDGTPIIELVKSVSASVGNESARKWLHFGATSQDAIDTGLMIQASRGLGTIDTRLCAIARLLRELAVEYRDQPHMGRTFLQEARPTTFGFRTAMWLDAVIGHVDELRRQHNCLQIQLGGPVGTLAAYGDKGPDVVSSVAGRLGLAKPSIAWHTNRTPVIALAQAVERAALTMGTIGSDVATLASSGIGEVSVRSGASSSMPEKRNPLDAIRAVAAAQACAGAVAMLSSALGHELDRGVGGWHVEWMALPLVFHTSGAAVTAIETCLQSLEVDGEKMNANAGPDTPPLSSAQIDRVLADYDRVIT
jgi:3-carboxy-cis,cis-muconate cycloisomerase